MKDEDYRISRPQFMHQVDLGKVSTEENLKRLVQDIRGSELLSALLQWLRDRSAEDRQAATACCRNRHYVEKDQAGNVHQMPMNDPVYHEGCAQGYEDAFWGLYEMSLVKKE